ncbi:MAG: hypothetical protein ACTHKJ_03180 [Candidatus Nitrosocosmicus sp.]
MGGNIPRSIKEAVLREWLLGNSREVIALNNGISTGSVSKILHQSKNNVPDLDMMREIALMAKKREINLSDIPAAIRLKKQLDESGVSEEKIEKFIEGIDIHCFQKEIGVKDFINQIHRVFNLSSYFEMDLEELPKYIEAAIRKKNVLDEQIDNKKKLINELFNRYNITEHDLQEYREDRQLQNTINNIRQKSEKDDNYIRLLKKRILDLEIIIIEKGCKFVLETELDVANKKLAENHSERIDPQELQEHSDRLFEYPSKYVDVIEIMRKRG